MGACCGRGYPRPGKGVETDASSGRSGDYPGMESTLLKQGFSELGKAVKPKSRMVFGYDTGFHHEYRVGKELGRGQFGITYLCEQRSTKAQYAVKTVKKRSLTSLDSVDDTKREVAILKRLSGHENIVQLRGVFEDDENIYICMELCAGGELFDKIIAKGHYAEKDAATLVRQMLNVVAECHLNGVIHR